MSVSLDLIRRLTDQGALSIPAEVAGCLLLAAAEQCLEGRRVSARSLRLESSGTVTANLDFDSDSSLGALKECLGGLIGDAPEARRLREGMDAADVSELVAVLRSALVPLNRPAARRSLVRLHRRIEQLGVELEGTPVPAPADLALPVVEPAPALPGPAWPAEAPEPIDRTQPLDHGADEVPAPTCTPEVFARHEIAPPPPVVYETPVVTRPVPRSEIPDDTPWEELPPAEAPEVRSGGRVWEPGDPAEPTLLLGTLGVGPHGRARVQQTLGAPSSDETHRIFAEGVAPKAGDEWSFPVPRDDDATSIEPAVEVDREPGLGRVTPKRSDVHELLAAFHVTLASDEEQLLSALRRTVESHGTPLPPSISSASLPTHKR